MKNQTLEELIEEFRKKYVRSDGEVEEYSEEIEAFIKKAYEAGYIQGVTDEIECVETAGEHADLRKLLKQP